MTLKHKLLLASTLLHLVLFVVAAQFHETLQWYLLVIEGALLLSLASFVYLIKKGLQPLEYFETFNALLKEQDFSARFKTLKQPELDRLISQFNLMLQQLQQERLKASERRGVFEKLMAESPVGVVLLDFEKRVSELNPAAESLLGLSPDSIVGKRLDQIDNKSTSYLKAVDVNTNQLVTAGQGRRLKIGHYDIRDRGFERSFYMIVELTGDIVQSQKAAYEKLIRLMSHEVNNTVACTNSLLESCLGFADQLEPDSREDYQIALDVIIKRGARLDAFMKGYADIVKLQAPIKTQLNLSKMLNDLTVLFYSECQKRDIDIVTELAQDVMISADASLIEQALINVLQNAIEAIDTQGSVTLSLSIKNNNAELVVKDSGSGISSEQEAQLFTPFYTSKESGQGVGLMLIREVLELHNYSYSLTNNAKEAGAQFVINAPVYTS